MLSLLIKHRILLINLLLMAAVLVGLYWAIHWVVPFVLPLIIGSLIALMIDPLVRFLTKIGKMPRWISTMFAHVLVFGGGLTLIIVLSAKLVIELADLLKLVPGLVNHLVYQFSGDFFRLYDWTNQWLATPSGGQLTQKIQDNIGQVAKVLSNIGQAVVNAILQVASNVPNVVTIFIISLFISYFVSKDLPHLKQKIRTFVPTGVQEKGRVVYQDLLSAIGGYVRAQMMLISITAIQVLAGLLVLRVPYAFSLALLAAFLDILPLLGTGSLFVPWIIFSFITGNMKLGVGLLILYSLIVLVRQVLEPRLLAGTIGLDPLAMIIVMYAGYVAYGFLGILLAPFILIVLQSLIKVEAFDILKDGHDRGGPGSRPPTGPVVK